MVGKEYTIVIPPRAERSFKVVGGRTSQLPLFFPALDSYSPQHTHYLEGSRPASVKD